MNYKGYFYSFRIQDIEADFQEKVSLKILNSGIILSSTHDSNSKFSRGVAHFIDVLTYNI